MFNIVMWFIFTVISSIIGAAIGVSEIFSIWFLLRDIALIIGALFLTDYVRENW
jgi:hypothetical protein